MRGHWTRWAGAALLISGAYWHFRAPQASPPRNVGILMPQIGHAGGTRALVVAPDGKSLATLGDTIKFWDLQSGALRRTLSLDKASWQPRNFRFSPDGRTLAFLDDTPQGTVLSLTDVATGRTRSIKTPVGYCREFSFIGTEKVALNINDQLQTYDRRSGRLLQQAKLASAYRWGAVAGGVVLAGYGKNWSLCDLQTGGARELSRAVNLQTATFSADGRTLVTGQSHAPLPISSQTKNVRHKITFSVVNIDDEPQIQRAMRPVAPPLESPDGTLALWDVQRGKLRRVITAFPAQVGAFRGVALSRSGHLVAAYGSESYKNGYRASVKLWDGATGRCKGIWPLASDGFLTTAVALSDDGTVSVAGLKTDESGVAGAPQVWNSRTLRWQGSASNGPTDEWSHLEWSPDGASLMGGSAISTENKQSFGGFSLWGGRYFSVSSLGGAVPTFIFSGAQGFSATTLRLWDLQKGKMRAGFWGPIVPPRSSAAQGAAALQQGGLAAVLGVSAFSPDSRLLVADEGGAIALRDVKSGALVRTLAALPTALANIGDWSQFLWSPHGNTLIALTKANAAATIPSLKFPATLTLWDTQNGKLKAVLAVSAQEIKAAYSADGRAVVAFVGGTPRGWDANGYPVNVAALPALPRGTEELCPRLLTRQGEIMRALRRNKTVFIETRALLNGNVTRYEFPAPFNSKSFAPQQLFAAPDGSSLAIHQANGALALWNMAEWKLLGHIENTSATPLAAPAPGGRLVAVARPEGAIEIYDPALSAQPLTLQVLPSLKARRGGQEWAVFSPQGFYNASPQASRQLRRLAAGKTLSP